MRNNGEQIFPSEDRRARLVVQALEAGFVQGPALTLGQLGLVGCLLARYPRLVLWMLAAPVLKACGPQSKNIWRPGSTADVDGMPGGT